MLFDKPQGNLDFAGELPREFARNCYWLKNYVYDSCEPKKYSGILLTNKMREQLI